MGGKKTKNEENKSNMKQNMRAVLPRLQGHEAHEKLNFGQIKCISMESAVVL